MELNQLLQFKAIVDAGNMSRAAQSLYISQPALSQNLAKLEKELGVQLFEHHKNKLILNENGQKVLRHVNIILDEINNIRFAVSPVGHFHERLRLSSYEDPSLRYFGATILGSFPELTLETSLRPDSQIIENLKNEQVDIAFSSNAVIDPEIFTTYLCETTMSVAVPPGHKLHGHSYLTWNDLNNQTFLMPAGYSYLFDKIGYIEKEKNIQLQRKIQRDFGLYRSMVNQTPYLTFNSTLDHMYTRNPVRADIPVVDPAVTIRYYASCKAKYTSVLLPFITCIQRYYWAYEKFDV